MRNQFTERDTEAFYDAEDALYRSFWDSEGSLPGVQEALDYFTARAANK